MNKKQLELVLKILKGDVKEKRNMFANELLKLGNVPRHDVTLQRRYMDSMKVHLDYIEEVDVVIGHIEKAIESKLAIPAAKPTILHPRPL